METWQGDLVPAWDAEFTTAGAMMAALDEAEGDTPFSPDYWCDEA